MELFKYMFLLVLVIGLTIGVGYGMSWLTKGDFECKTWVDYLAFLFVFSLMFLGSWLQQR